VWRRSTVNKRGETVEGHHQQKAEMAEERRQQTGETVEGHHQQKAEMAEERRQQTGELGGGCKKIRFLSGPPPNLAGS